MTIIQTQLYNCDNPLDLQESINLFLQENHIDSNNLIDIKYQQIKNADLDYKPGFTKYVVFFSALIIYQTYKPKEYRKPSVIPQMNEDIEIPF